MTDGALAEQVGSLRTFGTGSGVLLGVYSAMLLTGAAYMNHLYRGQEAMQELELLGGMVDPVLARGMRSKLSFTVFPGVVLAVLSCAVLAKRPHVPDSQSSSIDHLAFNRLQRRGKELVERTNIGRMMTNIFAVLFIWRMSTFYQQLDRREDAFMWFNFALAMGGAGLVFGLMNTVLYYRVNKAYRLLSTMAKTKFRRSF